LKDAFFSFKQKRFRCSACQEAALSNFTGASKVSPPPSSAQPEPSIEHQTWWKQGSLPTKSEHQTWPNKGAHFPKPKSYLLGGKGRVRSLYFDQTWWPQEPKDMRWKVMKPKHVESVIGHLCIIHFPTWWDSRGRKTWSNIFRLVNSEKYCWIQYVQRQRVEGFNVRILFASCRLNERKHKNTGPSPRLALVFVNKNIFPLESSKNTQKGRLTDLTVSFLTRSFYQKGQVSTWVPGPWEKSSATTTIPGFPAKLWWTSANHFLVPSGNTHVAIKNVAFEDAFPINNGEFSSPC